MQKLLMSKENPNGWKLEDILRQLIEEINEKSDRVRDSKAPDTARRIIRNNDIIVAYLQHSTLRQDDSLEALAELGADPGPTGTPRI